MGMDTEDVPDDEPFQGLRAAYDVDQWQRILNAHPIPERRKGTCLDNAVVEGFFGHLKEEVFHHETYDSVQELVAALQDYMLWFNVDRIQERLGDLSPVEYRTLAPAA